MDLSLLRQAANVRVCADVGHVYFTNAAIDITYYATHRIFNNI